MKSLKKIILLLLISALVVCFVACDDPTNPQDPPPVGPGPGSGDEGGNNPGGDQGGSGDEGGDEGDQDIHTHEYNLYVRTETHHQKKCACGDTLPQEEHNFGDTFVQNCAEYRLCKVCSYLEKTKDNVHTYHFEPEYVRDTNGVIISANTLERCSVCNSVGTTHIGLPDTPINQSVYGTPFNPEIGDLFYSVAIDMDRDEYYDRVIRRNLVKTYVAPILDIDNPSFPKEFDDGEMMQRRLEYVSDLLPYSVYDIDYAFSSIYLKTPFEIFTSIKDQVPSFYERFYNFIRFMTVVTPILEGDARGVLLKFEFDTSFIYQANGYVIRAKVTVKDPGSVSANTIEQLCSTPREQAGATVSYTQMFENMFGTRFVMKYLTEEDASTPLKAGDYVYCDINIGIPMYDSVDDAARLTLLSKDDLGTALGFYLY